MLAEKLGIDRLEFRWLNAHPRRRGDGDRPGAAASAGLAAMPRRAAAALARGARGGAAFNAKARGRAARRRHRAACGTASATPRCRNPSTMRIGLAPTGGVMLYNGAVDIGQGSNTILTQIAADALGRAGRRSSIR